MPFESKAQQRAAFGGHLGSKMKAKAKEFASKTDQSALPERKAPRKTIRAHHGAKLADLVRG